MDVALIQTGRLGDIVSSLGLVRAFVEQGHRVTLVTRAGMEQLLLDTTLAPVVTADPPAAFDTLVDLSQSHESIRLCRALKAGRRLAVFNRKRTGLLQKLRARRVYTEQLPKGSLHISERYRVVADRFGLPFHPATLSLVQPVPRLDRAVAVHVGTGQPVRVLPTDMLAGIVDGLLRLGADVRLFGTEHEIVGELQRATGQRVTHVRPSLRDLPGELARCRVFVGGDSGLLHLACALGIPSVGIYGPNVPVLSAPCCSHLTVVDTPCDCRPCDQRAPCPSDRACYRQIARDNLHGAIARAFQPGARPAPPFDHR